MNRLTSAAVFVLFLGFVAIAAPSALPQGLEPGEPEIVLPSVLLDLEDLSVESVTAAIPEEAESLPSVDLKFPLPEAGEETVVEPSVELQIPKTGFEGEESGKKRDFTAEAELGAGTLNHFFGRFSLYSLGQKPEGRILFQHETLDGFSGKPPGRGYDLRTDQLEGGLKVGAKTVRLEAAGSFIERERGLQEIGAFYSKIDRLVGLRADTELVPGGHFWMKTTVDGSATTRLLAGGGAGSEEITEYLLEPSLAFEYRFKRGALGVTPRVSYRGVPDRDPLSTARAEARVYARIDLNEATRFDGGVAWHYGDTSGNSVPFDIGLESDFTDYFTLSLRGGYRVEEMNLRDLFAAYSLMDVPAALDDGKGWFFEARANWIPVQGWIFNAGILYADSNAMPSFDRTPDPTSGLFPFIQEEALRVSVETGLRWNISEALSARLGWNAELSEKPEFFPRHKLLFEGSAEQKNGKFGGGLTAEYLLGVNDTDQLPTLGVSGFVQAAEFMRFTLEANDLLYPLLDGPRLEWYPFVAPGLTVTLKALINF
jgi:hypothetical protein